ncbi:hypothetical protein [Streptomyces sp. NPDC056987]|uniref:hypothetical protein n=1 Tax=Streptomyces sp. NPDC056987 TaxID=3345988 RepID=UPI003631BD5A
MTTYPSVQSRPAGQYEAAQLIGMLLVNGVPPVASWEITSGHVVRGLLAADEDAVTGDLRTVHQTYGGTVAVRNRIGHRELVARLTYRGRPVELWGVLPAELSRHCGGGEADS